MAVEVERKFLVKSEFINQLHSFPRKHIKQFYISHDPKRVVRVRIVDGQIAYLTLKGAGVSKPNGARACSEFEYEIPVDDAIQMVELKQAFFVEKTRYIIEYGGHSWEVDVFVGENGGLVMAEVELDSGDVTIDMPDWVGKEVSTDSRYANASLAVLPFSSWSAL